MEKIKDFLTKNKIFFYITLFLFHVGATLLISFIYNKANLGINNYLKLSIGYCFQILLLGIIMIIFKWIDYFKFSIKNILKILIPIITFLFANGLLVYITYNEYKNIYEFVSTNTLIFYVIYLFFVSIFLVLINIAIFKIVANDSEKLFFIIVASAAFALFNIYGNVSIRSLTCISVILDFFFLGFLLNTIYVKTKSCYIMVLLTLIYQFRKTFALCIFDIPKFLFGVINEVNISMKTLIVSTIFNILFVFIPALLCLIIKKKKEK